ncbi:MAG TPA: alpha/beta fold hydrolase [Ramlibacter sp.]|nr:alpha/beta fold hydrolase [Ramlibacter sp.]
MTPGASDWVEVNGVCLRYERRGSAGPGVVLLHEMGGAIESWDDVLAALGDGLQVLRYDQRGFGLSEKGVPITLADMVADLDALLEAAHFPEPVVLAGAALGAALALAFALRHPDRVRGLVLASPATGGATPAARAAMEARHAAIRAGGMRAVTDRMMAMTYPAGQPWHRERYERHRRRWLTTDPAAFIAVNEMLADLDLESQLPRIACPTLVVGCAHDPIRAPARSAEIAAQLPHARFVEAASGHYMPLQHPEEFATRLREFAATLQRG